MSGRAGGSWNRDYLNTSGNKQPPKCSTTCGQKGAPEPSIQTPADTQAAQTSAQQDEERDETENSKRTAICITPHLSVLGTAANRGQIHSTDPKAHESMHTKIYWQQGRGGEGAENIRQKGTSHRWGKWAAENNRTTGKADDAPWTVTRRKKKNEERRKKEEGEEIASRSVFWFCQANIIKWVSNSVASLVQNCIEQLTFDLVPNIN